MAVGSSRDLVRARTEDKVVQLVNAERAKRRLHPLTIDERLRRAARWHSADMARRGFFAHQATRGPSPFERMLAAGFEEPGGENIAAGQQTPAAVVRAWMQSIPHRANILHAEFQHIGVGVHIGPDGPWWTQNFGY
ncbi:CAP domain-containing protein [Saccharopolyspora hirsuta]|uniref:CAP domain-containing protein n=1 Tax=Saccharopolyspora hirsuta TaxID=1837 RepID=A0A5M7BKB1_SACHI|nr:CAP domain-containing protein [Saccharopolyspora hirsuta]KAA5830112.1 CAP domain-containing protein [Saccharopolyspora hirsuta]MBF6507437.1 CAP domain-containing protein [Nocardia farcinica]